MAVFIGTAGWAIPRQVADRFAAGESVLARYATRFTTVEINSSFYRSHRPQTWARWAAAVPPAFRFAVKMPRTISHHRKLVDCEEPLLRFLDEVGALGEKLAILLLQLPPKLAFEPSLMYDFMGRVRQYCAVPLVCEPRHPSWFEAAPDRLLEQLGVARVAADPACVPAASQPGGWRGLSYWRLHGSPRIYRSSYDDSRLETMAARLGDEVGDAWCIFDNTAAGSASNDALRVSEFLTNSNLR